MQKDIVLLESDAIRKELWGDENDQQNPAKVFQVMNQRTLEALKNNYDVVYDATNLSKKRRTNLIKELRNKIPELFCKCIVVVTHYDACIARQNMRERKVPEEVIFKQICHFQCPWYDEGWDLIDLKSGTSIFDNNDRLTVYQDISYHIKHDNFHHPCGTIGDHCDNVERNLRKISKNQSKMIDLGAYHDIGKVLTKRILEDGFAHYHNHDNVSSYMSLWRIGTIEKDLLLKQAVVIGYHMKIYSYKNNNTGYQKWLDSLNLEIRNMYIQLHEADKKDSY